MQKEESLIHSTASKKYDNMFNEMQDFWQNKKHD